MRVFRCMLVGLLLAFGAMTGARAQTVEIEYWQYVFEARIKAMDELIKRFQAANPTIKVKHTTFPYADYQTKIAAAMPAGQGPDVVQLFYGWLDNFVAAKFIQPLPHDVFPPAMIEKEFFGIVSAMKRNGEYYGLPTAVRSLATVLQQEPLQGSGSRPGQSAEDARRVPRRRQEDDEARRFRQHAFRRRRRSTFPVRTITGGARCCCARWAARPTAPTIAR